MYVSYKAIQNFGARTRNKYSDWLVCQDFSPNTSLSWGSIQNTVQIQKKYKKTQQEYNTDIEQIQWLGGMARFSLAPIFPCPPGILSAHLKFVFKKIWRNTKAQLWTNLRRTIFQIPNSCQSGVWSDSKPLHFIVCQFLYDWLDVFKVKLVLHCWKYSHKSHVCSSWTKDIPWWSSHAKMFICPMLTWLCDILKMALWHFKSAEN